MLLHHNPVNVPAKVALCHTGRSTVLHFATTTTRTSRFWAKVRCAALNSGVVNVRRGSSLARPSSICVVPVVAQACNSKYHLHLGNVCPHLLQQLRGLGVVGVGALLKLSLGFSMMVL